MKHDGQAKEGSARGRARSGKKAAADRGGSLQAPATLTARVERIEQELAGVTRAVDAIEQLTRMVLERAGPAGVAGVAETSAPPDRDAPVEHVLEARRDDDVVRAWGPFPTARDAQAARVHAKDELRVEGEELTRWTWTVAPAAPEASSSSSSAS